MNRAGPLIAPPSSSDFSEASKRLLPWLVAVAFFMVSLDTTILNTAVPAICSSTVTDGPDRSMADDFWCMMAARLDSQCLLIDKSGVDNVFVGRSNTTHDPGKEEENCTDEKYSEHRRGAP